MARHAIAEIDARRKTGRRAVRIVGEASEETADAADRNADRQRNRVEIASRDAESDQAFNHLDRDESTDERANDCFASDQVVWVVEVVPSHLRVFEPEQKFGAERCARDRGGNHGPAQGCYQRVSKAAAQPEIHEKGHNVRQRFEEKVRVDRVPAEM